MSILIRQLILLNAQRMDTKENTWDIIINSFLRLTKNKDSKTIFNDRKIERGHKKD